MPDFFKWLEAHRVSYVVLRHSPPHAMYDATDCPEMPLCARQPQDDGLREIWLNDDFRIFQVVR